MFLFYGFRHLNEGWLPKKCISCLSVCPAGLGGSVAFFWNSRYGSQVVTAPTSLQMYFQFFCFSLLPTPPCWVLLLQDSFIHIGHWVIKGGLCKDVRLQKSELIACFDMIIQTGYISNLSLSTSDMQLGSYFLWSFLWNQAIQSPWKFVLVVMRF